MTTLRRKEDFEPDEVLQWQFVVDKFFQIWVQLHGKNGITNYIHMLATGHVAEYLKYWKNLYAHSQQGKSHVFKTAVQHQTNLTLFCSGWEHLNSLIKVFYFKRTQKGGVGNRGKSRGSRLIPIAKWLLRQSMWASGVSYEAMVAEVKSRRAHARGQDGGSDSQDDDDVVGDDDDLLFADDGDDDDDEDEGDCDDDDDDDE